MRRVRALQGLDGQGRRDAACGHADGHRRIRHRHHQYRVDRPNETVANRYTTATAIRR
jgi:hypothetical protein